MMLIENRRRQAQRYALIGQATEDFDEVLISRFRTPACSSRTLAWAQDFVDVEAEGEEEEEEEEEDGLDLPQLSPPPTHPVLQPRADPQPLGTPVTPAVPAIQVRPVRFRPLQRCPAGLHPPVPAHSHSTHQPTGLVMAAGPARLHAASDAIGHHSRRDDQRELGGRDGVRDTGVRPAHRAARHAQQCSWRRSRLEAEHGRSRRAEAASLQDVEGD